MADEGGDIGLIRAFVTEVNTADLKSARHDFTCDEKGYVVYHYREGRIVKITVDWGVVGDAYHREEFYFDRGRLIFEYDLLKPAGAYPGDDRPVERRYYIKDNAVIRYLKGNEEQACESCGYGATSNAYRLLAADGLDVGKALCR